MSIVNEMRLEELKKEIANVRECSEMRMYKGRWKNFDSNTGKKLVEICDCYVLGKPFNCKLKKCPGVNLYFMMLKEIREKELKSEAVFDRGTGNITN